MGSHSIIMFLSLSLSVLLGHYTGQKRMEQKCRIKEEWRRTMENFHDSLVFTSETRKIGSRLHRNLDKIIAQFDAIPHKTLVHGDFKITNVFVDKAKYVRYHTNCFTISNHL
jgi:Ser/Thr protein kinase RdoA (MazF antagonist)